MMCEKLTGFRLQVSGREEPSSQGGFTLPPEASTHSLLCTFAPLREKHHLPPASEAASNLKAKQPQTSKQSNLKPTTSKQSGLKPVICYLKPLIYLLLTLLLSSCMSEPPPVPLTKDIAETITTVSKVDKSLEDMSKTIEAKSTEILTLAKHVSPPDIARNISKDAIAIKQEHEAFKKLTTELQNKVVPELKQSEALAKKQEEEIITLKSKEREILRWITIGCLFGMGLGIAIAVQFSGAIGKTIAITCGFTAIFCTCYMWLLTEKWIIETITIGGLVTVIALAILKATHGKDKNTNNGYAPSGLHMPQLQTPNIHMPHLQMPQFIQQTEQMLPQQLQHFIPQQATVVQQPVQQTMPQQMTTPAIQQPVQQNIPSQQNMIPVQQPQVTQPQTPVMQQPVQQTMPQQMTTPVPPQPPVMQQAPKQPIAQNAPQMQKPSGPAPQSQEAQPKPVTQQIPSHLPESKLRF